LVNGSNADPVSAAAGLAAVALGSMAVQVIGQGDEALVERLGIYNRRLGPGLHFLIPIIERVSYRQTLREKVLDIPPQQCITADNAPITADAVVYFRVVDTYLARYKVENLVDAVQNLVLTQIRNEIGRLSLDETFSARTQLNSRLLAELESATKAWGVSVVRVEVRDILPAQSITAALEKQMTAERTKRAAILNSEGEQAAAINVAEGVAKAKVLAANAEAEAAVRAAEAEKSVRELEAQGLASALSALGTNGLDSKEASNLVLSVQYLTAAKAIGTSPSSKVLFLDPASVPAALASLEGVMGNGGVQK